MELVNVLAKQKHCIEGMETLERSNMPANIESTCLVSRCSPGFLCRTCQPGLLVSSSCLLDDKNLGVVLLAIRGGICSACCWYAATSRSMERRCRMHARPRWRQAILEYELSNFLLDTGM
jgi:hypothetical protein